MLFDEEGNPYDYEFTDINSSGLEILNCNASDYVGKRASSLGIDVKKRIAVLAELLYTKEHKEINFRLDGSNKYCHSVAYSPQGNDIVIMFSDMTETFAAHERLTVVREYSATFIRTFPSASSSMTKTVIW